MEYIVENKLKLHASETYVVSSFIELYLEMFEYLVGMIVFMQFYSQWNDSRNVISMSSSTSE